MTDRLQELFDVSSYLGEHARSDFANMPEKTVAGVLNTLSPDARHAFATQYVALDHLRESGGRTMPFEKKEDYSEGLPKPLLDTVRKIDDERIVNGLHERMGTQQAQQALTSEPPSLRDIVSASADIHSGE